MPFPTQHCQAPLPFQAEAWFYPVESMKGGGGAFGLGGHSWGHQSCSESRNFTETLTVEAAGFLPEAQRSHIARLNPLQVGGRIRASWPKETAWPELYSDCHKHQAPFRCTKLSNSYFVGPSLIGTAKGKKTNKKNRHLEERIWY